MVEGENKKTTGKRSIRRAPVLLVAVAVIVCASVQVVVAAPTATVQGTDDHDTTWRVGNLSDRLALLEQQALNDQHDLFKANCRHMDDALFTIKNRLERLPEGDQVQVVISQSPVAVMRNDLDSKKQQKDALLETGKKYLHAISELDQQIAAGVDKFHMDWLKTLFGQLKPAVGLPKVYEIPTEFWDWYQSSKQAGEMLSQDVSHIQKLRKLRDALRVKQQESVTAARQVVDEINALEPTVQDLENAFNSVVAKYPFVIVGNAPPPVQTQAPKLSICFLVDCSGSMAGSKIEAARAAVRSSVARTDDGKTEWALLAFGACNLWEEVGFNQTAADITAAADGLSTGGDTPLTFSMYKAIAYVSNEGRGATRRLIILCDGQDNCSERGSTTQEDAMAGLKTITRNVPATGGTQP